jgi:hypothetical protein
MDRYVKFCKSRHNILLGCPNLQVGTLEYYRKMDSGKGLIADSNEQLERTIILSYDSTIADKHASSRLVGIHADDTSRINIEQSVHEMRYPNCYVYCLTKIGENDEITGGKEYDKDYDSYFIINNIKAFADELAKLIMETSTLDIFSDAEAINKLSIPEIKQIRLEYIHKPITYVDSKTATIDQSRIKGGSSLEDLYDRIIFTKDNKYKHQNEYRILFVFVHPKYNKILPVKKDPIIIDISPIKRYLSSQ